MSAPSSQNIAPQCGSETCYIRGQDTASGVNLGVKMVGNPFFPPFFRGRVCPHKKVVAIFSLL